MQITCEEEEIADIEKRRSLTHQYVSTQLRLTKEEVGFLHSKVSSKLWRLNKLYTIYNKDGLKGIMTLNPMQMKILRYKYLRKIILKARQLGISTLFVAYNLDSCIFTPGYQAGIQSYGLDESDKLSKRADLMWEELDPNIKSLLGIELVSNNSKGMTFNNGSIFKIGNFRGDTLQSLHVSEYGKISKKAPDKAAEIKKGAFQAVSSNNKITIESTAEGKSGAFYNLWEKSYRKYKKVQAGNAKLSPHDFYPIFLNWIDHQEYRIEDEQIVTPRYTTYFSRLEKKLNVKITDEQKWWYISKAEELAEGEDASDMHQEYPSLPEEAFETTTIGLIFKKEYDLLYRDNRIRKGVLEKGMTTYVSYDLGVNDKTVLLYHAVTQGIPKIVYCYANTGENIEHYVEVMYAIGKKYDLKIPIVYLPHDAKVKDYSTGRTRIEEFRRLGAPAVLVNKQSVADGIHASRQYLRHCIIDKEHCKELVDAILDYRWKEMEKYKILLDVPLHNDASNYLDSLKYGALGMSYHRVKDSIIKPKVEKVKIIPNEKEIGMVEVKSSLRDMGFGNIAV